MNNGSNNVVKVKIPKNNIQIIIIRVNLLKHMVDDYSKLIQQ